MHVRVCVCARACAHTNNLRARSCVCAHARARVCARERVRAVVHICVRLHARTHSCARGRGCVRARVRALCWACWRLCIDTPRVWRRACVRALTLVRARRCVCVCVRARERERERDRERERERELFHDCVRACLAVRTCARTATIVWALVAEAGAPGGAAGQLARRRCAYRLCRRAGHSRRCRSGLDRSCSHWHVAAPR